MKPKVVIRRMTLADLDAVQKIERTVFTDPWSRESYRYEIRQNRFSFPVVLEVGGEVVGYAVAWRIYEEFHIANLAIAPEHQGKGWGKLLLNFLLEQAGGAKFALLEVRRSNRRAIRLYEKFGFQPFGVRPRYYHDQEDALVMRKQLR
ncbi:MAG: ribosomal-protein-alanine N-acetyltransferase [Calditrichaeota bacterium]|nr:MAG: ribosomal-protein-alanine N-acetyltransferase [Calditrichota bacterium]